MEACVWSNTDKLTRVNADHFELHRTVTAAHREMISLPSRSVGFQELWLQVGVEKVSRETFDRII